MKRRARICIPTYNNPATIAEVVRGCLAASALPLLVVDDGSTSPVSSLLAGPEFRAAFEAGRLELLRLPENCGKGMALRTAFGHSSEQGFTHVLVLDGDGQHFPESLKLLEAAGANRPEAIVIGCREMSPDKTPGISRFGRAISNLWIRSITGVATKDSQSGMRLYPLAPMEQIEFRCARYDFELEVLMKLFWRGTPAVDVSIPVHYPDPAERVSHFHKVWDNVRIGIACFRLSWLKIWEFSGERSNKLEKIGRGGGI